MTVAVCKRCRNPIERTSLGGWGTRVRMIRGCRHVPAKDSVREVADGVVG